MFSHTSGRPSFIDRPTRLGRSAEHSWPTSRRGVFVDWRYKSLSPPSLFWLAAQLASMTTSLFRSVEHVPTTSLGQSAALFPTDPLSILVAGEYSSFVDSLSYVSTHTLLVSESFEVSRAYPCWGQALIDRRRFFPLIGAVSGNNKARRQTTIRCTLLCLVELHCNHLARR
jgi:hypothetical protein